MGCGNNKVSRSYLTSQPITTPSTKALRGGSSTLGGQVLRLIAEQSAAKAAQARASREMKEAEAKASAVAEQQAAEKKAEKKKKKKEREEQETEHARRLMTAMVVDMPESPTARDLLPGQPDRTLIRTKGGLREVPSFASRATEKYADALVGADRRRTDSELHIHAKVKADGTVYMQGTDRRGLKDEHFGEIQVTLPYAPPELVSAMFDVVAEMLQERE